MITNIELTETGVEKFNQFFNDCARDGVRSQAVLFEALDVFQERVISGESLSYELGKSFTATGRPEILYLTRDDILVTEESDD
jgi:hypothetical protein